MREDLTYKDKLRRTELIQLHEEFQRRMDEWRPFVGILSGGFFCEHRAMHWDHCQKREPAPESGGRPEGWLPQNFYPDEYWGMEKWWREGIKRAWMPRGEEERTAASKAAWAPVAAPGRPSPPPEGEDLLSQVVEGIIHNWSLVPTADEGIRHYLLTNGEAHLSHAALAYSIKVEAEPMKGATVTIRGLHPYLTQSQKDQVWDSIRWRLMYYALVWPDLYGKDKFQIKRRPNQQRDFFICKEMQFVKDMTIPAAIDKWLKLHPERRRNTKDGDEGAVRKAYDRLTRDIEAMQPLA